MTIIRRMSPGDADVVLFAQAQEAITGADFELLVFHDGKYVAYLVQAKAMKADRAKEGYSRLGERDGATLQFNKLLACCAPGGPWAGHGALHVFYNGELLKSGATWPNDRCMHAAARDQAARGIAVAPTADIAVAVDEGRRSYRYDRIAPVCWPWWCLFCCGRPGLAALADRSGGHFHREPPSNEPDGGDRPSRGPRPPTIRDVADAPTYVRAARGHEGRRRVVPLPPNAQLPAASTVMATDA